MGRSILLNVFSAVVLVIAVAVGYYLLILERWAFVKSLDKKDFDTGDFKVYHTEDIKTVRYVPGHLGEVLREVRALLSSPLLSSPLLLSLPSSSPSPLSFLSLSPISLSYLLPLSTREKRYISYRRR